MPEVLAFPLIGVNSYSSINSTLRSQRVQCSILKIKMQSRMENVLPPEIYLLPLTQTKKKHFNHGGCLQKGIYGIGLRGSAVWDMVIQYDIEKFTFQFKS